MSDNLFVRDEENPVVEARQVEETLEVSTVRAEVLLENVGLK